MPKFRAKGSDLGRRAAEGEMRRGRKKAGGRWGEKSPGPRQGWVGEAAFSAFRYLLTWAVPFHQVPVGFIIIVSDFLAAQSPALASPLVPRGRPGLRVWPRSMVFLGVYKEKGRAQPGDSAASLTSWVPAQG